MGEWSNQNPLRFSYCDSSAPTPLLPHSRSVALHGHPVYHQRKPKLGREPLSSQATSVGIGCCNHRFIVILLSGIWAQCTSTRIVLSTQRSSATRKQNAGRRRIGRLVG